MLRSDIQLLVLLAIIRTPVFVVLALLSVVVFRGILVTSLTLIGRCLFHSGSESRFRQRLRRSADVLP